MSGASGDPDELDRLVAASLAGEPGAMDRLLRVLWPLVVRYCRSRLGGFERVNASPDDVAQEVCLAVLRALPGYRDQGRPFLAFVYGIAQHKVVDARRSAGRDRSDPVEELPEEQDVRDGPEQHAVQLAESTRMAALLDQLPEKQREILRLRVVVGLSAEETAEAVGSTAGAVRVAQHRALGKLRQLVTTAAAADGDPEPPRRRQGPSPARPGSPVARDPAPTGPLTIAAPPGGGLDWRSAPRTGAVELDRRLDLADAHVLRVGGGAATGWQERWEARARERLETEDARMAAAAAALGVGSPTGLHR